MEKKFWNSLKWWDMVLAYIPIILVAGGLLPKEFLLAAAPPAVHQVAQGMADLGKNRKQETQAPQEPKEPKETKAERQKDRITAVPEPIVREATVAETLAEFWVWSLAAQLTEAEALKARYKYLERNIEKAKDELQRMIDIAESINGKKKAAGEELTGYPSMAQFIAEAKEGVFRAEHEIAILDSQLKSGEKLGVCIWARGVKFKES